LDSIFGITVYPSAYPHHYSEAFASDTILLLITFR